MLLHAICDDVETIGGRTNAGSGIVLESPLRLFVNVLGDLVAD